MNISSWVDDYVTQGIESILDETQSNPSPSDYSKPQPIFSEAAESPLSFRRLISTTLTFYKILVSIPSNTSNLSPYTTSLPSDK